MNWFKFKYNPMYYIYLVILAELLCFHYLFWKAGEYGFLQGASMHRAWALWLLATGVIIGAYANTPIKRKPKEERGKTQG